MGRQRPLWAPFEQCMEREAAGVYTGYYFAYRMVVSEADVMQRDAALTPAGIGTTSTRIMQTSSSKIGTTWTRSFQSSHPALTMC